MHSKTYRKSGMKEKSDIRRFYLQSNKLIKNIVGLE